MILTSVLLPAPFSPSSAWIWLWPIVRSTASLARRPGNCLVIAVSCSNGGFIQRDLVSRCGGTGSLAPRQRPALCQLPLDSLHQPLHLVQRLVIHHDPGSDFLRPGLIGQRPDENLVLSGGDVGHLLGRDAVPIRRHVLELPPR